MGSYGRKKIKKQKKERIAVSGFLLDSSINSDLGEHCRMPAEVCAPFKRKAEGVSSWERGLW